MDYNGPSVLLSGPAGTGKSRGCLEKLNMIAWKYPGTRLMILRKTRVSLTETTLVTFEDKVLGLGNPIIGKTTRMARHAYDYPNGTTIVCGGLDKPSRHMSSEFDCIFIPEMTELTETDYEMIFTRLRNGKMPFQQLIGDCNPDRPTHWLKQKADAGVVKMFYSVHEDNPTLYDRETQTWTKAGLLYLDKLDQLTGARKLRLRHGIWSSVEGAVYDEWDESIHLIDRQELPTSWRWVLGIDFGFNNPFVAQLWAIDPDGNMILYREIYMSNRTVEEHVPAIKKMIEGFRVEMIIADHDAEDRKTLERHGLSTRPAIKTVSPGIQAVKERLKINPRTGKPRLYIMRDSLQELDHVLEEAHLPCSTLQELPGYVWSTGYDGRPNKELPVKRDDHGVDCCRYVCQYVDNYDPDGGVH